jgi:hypothetical protein
VFSPHGVSREDPVAPHVVSMKTLQVIVSRQHSQQLTVFKLFVSIDIKDDVVS